jgi:acyl-CoA hydrolase
MGTLQKNISESCVEMNNLVLPSHTNALGTIFGGTIMSWVDIAAAICALRHSREVCVTVSIDRLKFLAPAYVGQNVNVRARLIHTGKTSMMIEVDAFTEDLRTGDINKCVSAHLTFVALDDNKKPTAVPGILLETDQQKKDFENAENVRKELLKQ